MKVNIGPYVHNDDEERVIDVQIEDHDTYSADHTLSHIIVPLLESLKENKAGAPFVDNEDVPEELHRPPKEEMDDPYSTDEHWYARWEYVLDRMIEAFKFVRDEDYCFPGLKEEEKIIEGTRLFGKYYRCLWT